VNKPIAVFDLDGVLAEYHGYGDGAIGKPLELGVNLAKRLHSEGFKIVVQTCRTNYSDNYESRVKEKMKVLQWLYTFLPFAELCEDGKAQGHVYLDDRGVHISPNWMGIKSSEYVYGAVVRLAFDAIEQEKPKDV
jgi:hypothetical protein